MSYIGKYVIPEDKPTYNGNFTNQSPPFQETEYWDDDTLEFKPIVTLRDARKAWDDKYGKIEKAYGQKLEYLPERPTAPTGTKLSTPFLCTQKLTIDIETFSPVDLKKAGMYKYAEKVEILLLAYKVNNDPQTVCIDLYNKRHLAKNLQLPGPVYRGLTDPKIIKHSHNAPFEIVCLGLYFGIEIDLSQWECSMKRGAICGLPLSLDQLGKALGAKTVKNTMGMQLIRYFCIPCKPSNSNNNRTRNLPEHAPQRWEEFKRYVVGDVDSEYENDELLEGLGILSGTWYEAEKKLWILDQQINQRGVKVNALLIKHAITMDLAYRDKLIAEAIQLTGVEKPNSVAQLKKWLEIEEDITVDSLKKDQIPLLIKKCETKKAKRVLNIRQELSKTSVKKYTSMYNCVCADGRIRGLLQFYGANRTGRWAGRLVQVQNLPKGHFSGNDDMNRVLIDGVRELAMRNDAAFIEAVFGAIPDALSQIIRTAFVAEEGKRFVVSDFSAIEARVIAWLAGEKWRMEVFATHGKIYEASASQMFKLPLEAVTKGSDYRAKGKISELALGYQGGVDALIRMGALDMGVKEDELQGLVDAWRAANTQIKNLWYTMGRAAIQAVKTGGKVHVAKGLYFTMRNGYLLMYLPSGRPLVYAQARVEDGKYGEKVTYWGVDQTTKRWAKNDTYGGKLTENAVQGIARDCLANGMMNLDSADYSIVLHVHDEVVCEVPEGEGCLEEVNMLLCKKAAWMGDLPLKAEGFENNYYRKD